MIYFYRDAPGRDLSRLTAKHIDDRVDAVAIQSHAAFAGGAKHIHGWTLDGQPIWKVQFRSELQTYSLATHPRGCLVSTHANGNILVENGRGQRPLFAIQAKPCINMVVDATGVMYGNMDGGVDGTVEIWEY